MCLSVSFVQTQGLGCPVRRTFVRSVWTHPLTVFFWSVDTWSHAPSAASAWMNAPYVASTWCGQCTCSGPEPHCPSTKHWDHQRSPYIYAVLLNNGIKIYSRNWNRSLILAQLYCGTLNKLWKMLHLQAITSIDWFVFILQSRVCLLNMLNVNFELTRGGLY